ncbi:patatin-like phospholipase family protein [Musicola paradisiaca]|nr:patatin-like phospholipase family protein [Musicola paradisiaca]
MMILLAIIAMCACSSSPRHAGFQGAWLTDTHLRTRPEPSSPVVAPRPARLALALGGGGLRGYAHVGVLQALEEAGIHPDMVVGTSVGALVGAAYASGVSPAELWHIADGASLSSLADVSMAGPGFIRGEALAGWTNKLVGGKTIEHFPSRFAAVATDLNHALPFVITAGDAGEAVRASAAIPGIFLPVRADGNQFVDGGVVSLVPVLAARALGAQIVVAVDIYCHGPGYDTHSAVAMILRVSQVQSCRLADQELAFADVVIAPSVSPASMNSADGREQARHAGYLAAKASLPALLRTLQTDASSR